MTLSEIFFDNNNNNIEHDISINNIFKLPIQYNNKVQKLNPRTIKELELIETNDNEESSIYENLFKPTNKPVRDVIKQLSEFYTTDTNFLKETQELTKNLKSSELNTLYNKYNFRDFDMDDVVNSWEEIKRDNGFCSKYFYIDWGFAKQLNNHPHFLHLMSLYNIASPILSLCLPIFVLIIPFIIIKIKGIKLDIKQYIEILKQLISNNAIFKIFTQFNEVSTSQKLYLVASSIFYLFSIYQNIIVCIRFYSNMQKIHNYIFKFKNYLAYTIDLMNYYYSKTQHLSLYSDFNTVLKEKQNLLVSLLTQTQKIQPFGCSFSKINDLGHIMHTFYQLYESIDYNNAVVYSFGFNGYFNLLSHTSTNINNFKLSKTTFSKKSKPVFKKMYYPKFINETKDDIIMNDCNISKNIIITGPNAAGKTTTIKTALINILLSQQIGFGCFESLKLTPFDKIHCYLNIPDTSGRDSLFQAEARRCKEIIECIDDKEHIGLNHFCIFDELYSGTNPDEAVVSARAFMEYISKKKNVSCCLTTHYIKMCKKLEKNKNIKNFHMKTNKLKDNLVYTYKMCEGISEIKGGLKILHDLKYPKELLDSAS